MQRLKIETDSSQQEQVNNQLKLKESFPFFIFTKFKRKLRSGPLCLALDALVLLPGLLCHPDDVGDAEICVCAEVEPQAASMGAQNLKKCGQTNK